MLKKLFGSTVYALLSGMCGLIAINVFNVALPLMLNVALSIMFTAAAIAFLYGIYLEVSE